MKQFKFFKSLGVAVIMLIALLAVMLISMVITPSSHGQINSPTSEATIDAARLRAFIGGTNATAGVTTNKTFIIPGSLTNTFVIVNGIITSVTTP